MHPLVNIAVSAARAAGNHILRHAERVESLQIERKTHNDFVSQVDRGAEMEIVRLIHKAYPDHAILAEESGEQAGSEVRWIIDPLDGTTNFLHRIPHYAVSIGIEVRGRLEHGVIYAPSTNDLYVATRGSGAMLNNRRLRCSNTRELDDALIGTGVPLDDRFMPDYLPMLGNVATSTAGIRRAGSAALDLAYVAAGRLDGFFEFNLKPWDIAAGIVLVQEATGVVRSLRPDSEVLVDGHILAANNRLIEPLAQRLLSGPATPPQ
ncbi:inositol monophosphatase [Flagellatimonas centrodinii]|uniref:inositol monophosphatase family protein n=1 Tax=Flagellatimonas centrodinii TaxID=2806210 RepID=UPI001FED678B|nr:inositol monophosphatase family protein [Flagellatimonas centrodinii]ULQ45607.1 inositol monophosphatase [Flagellatimonas centrodinii]